jgi:hypothetical protein
MGNCSVSCLAAGGPSSGLLSHAHKSLKMNSYWRTGAARLESDHPKPDYICRYFKIGMAIKAVQICVLTSHRGPQTICSIGYIRLHASSCKIALCVGSALLKRGRACHQLPVTWEESIDIEGTHDANAREDFLLQGHRDVSRLL